MSHYLSTDTRAVSNTLGYAFTFAIIVMAILFLLNSGFGGLSDARDAAEGNNAVKAFDILSNNIEDLYLWDAPSRSTEVKLSGGQIDVVRNDASRTNISTVVYDPNTDTYSNYSTSSFPVVYDTDGGTRVVYDTGILMRLDGSQSARLGNPPLSFSSSRSTLTFVKGRGSASTTGDTTKLLIAQHRGSSLQIRNSTHPPERPLSVNINIGAPPERLPAWKSYFEREGLTPVDDSVSDGSITYTYETNRILIRSTTVFFTFDRST